MVVRDTHVWVWWAHGVAQLAPAQEETIRANELDIIGVNAISCWKIAKLVEYKRLTLPVPLDEWFEQALNYPGIRLLELTPEIAIESTHLPGNFHRDPADQMIVATARVHHCPLLTSDEKILNYPHVQAIS